MKSCRRYVISGKVQGVFYRQSTFEQAEQLGIKGWVRNLDNGDVECLACGEDALLDRLELWLSKGPARAKVMNIQRSEHLFEEHSEFVIRR